MSDSKKKKKKHQKKNWSKKTEIIISSSATILQIYKNKIIKQVEKFKNKIKQKK
jgi:hypothetical protein